MLAHCPSAVQDYFDSVSHDCAKSEILQNDGVLVPHQTKRTAPLETNIEWRFFSRVLVHTVFFLLLIMVSFFIHWTAGKAIQSFGLSLVVQRAVDDLCQFLNIINLALFTVSIARQVRHLVACV